MSTQPPAQRSSGRSSLLWAFIAVPLLVSLLFAGARPLGPLPPLGGFLDPANGIWAVAAGAELPRASKARIPGLEGPVRVTYDRRGVPHIFAETETDAQRALGYVVARDRLFQLEVQERVGAGTLTELIGPEVLPIDREARALGLPRAAERAMAALDSAAPERAVIQAFADGVNAWISQLSAREIPLEYRLLNRGPARWLPINSFHLFNRMGWTLAVSRNELLRLDARARVGRAAADALFPVNNPIQEPIQPNGRNAPRFDFIKVPPPGAPDTVAVELARMLPVQSLRNRAEDALGSNNWAVSPSRTASGFALLAGDPHLELTLPSIWYEAHLVVPGKLDVYGVTIPGAPAVIIGFNRSLAWSFTNTEADVVDMYAEVVDDSVRPTKYRLDGAWVPLERRVEMYRGRGGEAIAADTLLFNRRGPLTHSRGRWISTRWTVLEGGSSMRAFAAVAHAGTVSEYMKAMESYGAPPQNMLMADRSGSIGIRSTGRFPLRPGNGRGDELRDGSRSANDWTGEWSWTDVPQSVNPRQGYLASANQQPVDPLVQPRYLGANWYSPWRALRINTLLRADSQVTSDGMRRFQTDPGSARADHFVPAFLAAAHAHPGAPDLGRAAGLLSQWDRRYTRDNQRAILFESAMRSLVLRLWDELSNPAGGAGPWEGPLPGESVVAELLADPDNPWWDDRRTPAVEHRDDLLNAALEQALRQTIAERGDPDGGGWRWDRVRHANIYHLLRIPAFSRLHLAVQGGPSTLSPSSGNGTDGASWRMVVQLGPEVHGWATYPGGQSGNPVSRRYAEHLDQWLAGELDSLRFPRRPEELSGDDAAASLMLESTR